MSLSFYQNPFIQNYYRLDSSIYEYVGKLITGGSIPYRDVFEHKGPVFFLWYALGYTIHPMIGQWFLELILLFLDLIFVYRIAQKYISDTLFFMLSISVFVIVPLLDTIGNTESISWTLNLGLINILYNFLHTNKLSGLSAFFIGLISAFLLLIKPTYLPCSLIVISYITITFLQNKKYHQILHFLLYGGTTFFTILISILGWLWYHNALQDFWFDYYLFNILYTKKFRLLGTYTITFLHFAKQPFTWFSIVAIIGTLLKFKVFSKQEQIFLLILILSALIGIFFIILPCNSHNHYLAGILPFTWILYIFIAKNLNVSQSRILLIILFLLILIHTPIAIYNYFNYMQKRALELHATKDIAFFIKHRLKENEKFAAFSHDSCSIYLYSGHDAHSKYAFISSIAQLHPDIITKYLSENPPTWIVTDSSYAPLVDFQQYTIVYQNSRMIVWNRKLP